MLHTYIMLDIILYVKKRRKRADWKEKGKIMI